MKVQAGLLTTLLLHGVVPCLESGKPTELHLQCGWKDYKIDDALIVALDANGVERRQLWSIKERVKFIASNNEFTEVIERAWEDFCAPGRFNHERDSFVLATGLLAADSYRHFRTLLEWARASANSQSFVSRVARHKYASKEMRDYLSLVKDHCTNAAGQQVTEEQLWRFVRCFHLLTYDFDQQASQDEARFQALLSLAIKPGTQHTGSSQWNAIFKLVADLNPRAGSFTSDSPQLSTLRGACVSIENQFEAGAVHRLLDHSTPLLRRIQQTIGPTHIRLPRTDVVDALAAAIVSNRLVLVTGTAGVGKSAAVIPALDRCREGAPLFVFNAADFAYEHLNQVLANLRIDETIPQLSSLFALHPEKYLLIESVERLLEAERRDAFSMLLDLISADFSWRIIITCRQYAARMVHEYFLRYLGFAFTEVSIPLLSGNELDSILDQNEFANLRVVASNPRTRRLLRNPWYLDKACRVKWPKTPASPLDEARLRDILWRQVVMREDFRTSGIHFQRESCFRSVSLRRAKSLHTFVGIEPGEEAAANELIKDELLVEEPGTRNVAPAHDVLEDWALTRWVSETFSRCGQNPKVFFQSLGTELPIRRSYRQWLQEALASDAMEEVRHFGESIMILPDLESYWRDETFVSILLSDDAERFIQASERTLMSNEKASLFSLIHVLRLACVMPNPHMPNEVALAAAFGDSFLVPQGRGWGEVLRLIHRNISSFTLTDMPLVLGLIEDWKRAVHWTAPTPDGAREAGLIVLHFWRLAWAEKVWQKEIWDRLAVLLLAAPSAIPDEFQALLEEILRKEDADARKRRAT